MRDVLTENLAYITRQMALAAQKAGRGPEQVKLVAVSKGQPAQALAKLAKSGQLLFGESYLQEAEAKLNALIDFPQIIWHFIGPVQSNKAARVVNGFSCLESLHKKDLAQRLNRLAEERNKTLTVLLQVNLAGEDSKSGCAPDQVEALAQYVAELPHLKLKGLMTLPPFSDDQEQTRPYFARLRELATRLEVNLPPGSMAELSMGMSGDFKAAIEEGATLVRVGTALFGPRLG